ncbi:MAG TPA: hypothetical protein VK555_07600 [Terriglobales bacterium]|nr:hypothetical protein [Terriglobales bacterium]
MIPGYGENHEQWGRIQSMNVRKPDVICLNGWKNPVVDGNARHVAVEGSATGLPLDSFATGAPDARQPLFSSRL